MIASQNDDANTQGILLTAQYRSEKQPKRINESIATPAVQRKVLALKDTDTINRRQNTNGKMQRRPKRSRDFLKTKLKKELKVQQVGWGPVAHSCTEILSILRSRPLSAPFTKSKQKQNMKVQGIFGVKIEPDVIPADRLFKSEDLVSFKSATLESGGMCQDTNCPGARNPRVARR